MTEIENESPLEVTIDTEGMETRIVEKFNVKFKAIEEMLTEREKTKALTEGKTGAKPIDFDWRVGIKEMLKSFKPNDNIQIDTWQDRRTIETVAVRTYNEETKTHDYGLTESLVEAIGTIASGASNCCIPEIWADKIERDHVYPGSVFLGAWFVNVWPFDHAAKTGTTIYRASPAIP